MIDKLKPCPFCGGEVKTAVITFDEKFYEPPYEAWYLEHTDIVAASEAHCPIPTTDTFYDTEAEAIAAWNTRADDYRQAAEYWQRMYEEAFAERTCKNISTTIFRCSECDAADFDYDKPSYCHGCGAKVVSE